LRESVRGEDFGGSACDLLGTPFSDAFARQVAMKCEGVLFVPFSPSGMLRGPSERASSEDKSTTKQPEDS
jgi:hypothetical protein